MSKVDKEVALDELENFVNKFRKKPTERNLLEGFYPDVLDAIIDGFLVFDEHGKPVYTLKDVLKTEKENVDVSEIRFQERILPTQLADLGKGLHPINDMLIMQLRMTAFIIGQPIKKLDKFSKYDYDAISQIASVFS